MSALIYTGNLNTIAFVGLNMGLNDESIQPVDYRSMPPHFLSTTPQDSDWQWPRSRMNGGGSFATSPQVWDAAAQAWEWNVLATGQTTRTKVSGKTLDASGNPLAGVTVALFNTPTNLVVDTSVSDANGNYGLGDPNATTNFVVAYLPGSPDVAGTTVDTISGV